MTSSPDDDASSRRLGGGTAAAETPGAVPSDGGAPSSLHALEQAVHQLEADVEHRPPPAGPVTNVVVAALVVVLGAAALLGSLSLGAGSASTPGTGTWPLLISLAIVVLGVALVATARSTSDAERFSRSSWLVVAGLATMVFFVLAIETIGFEIPAGLLAFVWLRFLGRESWRSSIVTSLGVVIAFYLVFVAALSVPIPHLF